MLSIFTLYIAKPQSLTSPEKSVCHVIIITVTRKRCTGQVLPSAKYRPMRLVVDAALRRIGKSRHGGHKIANIYLP